MGNLYRLPEQFCEVLKYFPISPRKVEPYKMVYRIEAEEGFFALKEIKYPEDEFCYIYAATEHLAAQGFDRINRMILSQKFYPFVEYNGKRYFLSRWIIGREANYHQKSDLKIAARTLAELHKSSKGFEPPYFEGRIKWGSWPSNMLNKTKELLQFKAQVINKSRKTFFDEIFLAHVDYYVDESKHALETLIKENYEKVNKEDAKNQYFCHHDYANHNVIIDRLGQGHVIDFDYCISDIRCHDVASLMLRVMKRNKWNYKKALYALKCYDHVRRVSSCEGGVISAILRFPQDFWQVAFAYYIEENQPRERLERKIKHWVMEKELRKNSLKRLKKLM